MGFGGGSNKKMIAQQKAEAEEARRREAERQARLDTGRDRVNSIFGEFNDDYYNQYRQDHENFYRPQLEEQFDDAHKQTTFGLYRAGLGRSSAGNDTIADLFNQKDIQSAGITSKADQAAAGLKGRVAQEKQSAMSQLYATEDPEVAASTSLGAVQALGAPPSYNPLGDLFKLAGVVGKGFGQGNSNAYGYLNAGGTAGGGLPGTQGVNYGN